MAGVWRGGGAVRPLVLCNVGWCVGLWWWDEKKRLKDGGTGPPKGGAAPTLATGAVLGRTCAVPTRHYRLAVDFSAHKRV